MRHVAVIAAATLLSGCADLTAVRDISSRLTNATSSWIEVGADIVGSCERETMLNPTLSSCEAERRATDGMIAANKVLGAYFKVLFEAANDSNFTIQPGLDMATKSVAGIPDIKEERANAVSGLVGFLDQLATSAMRGHTLRQVLDGGAPNAKSVIEGLDEVLAQPLAGRLDTEKTYLTAIYVKHIRDQKDVVDGEPSGLCRGSKAAGFSGTGFLLAQDYCRRLSEIEAREKAVVAYQASLKNASSALTELQSSKAKLKARNLAKRLYEIGFDLDDQIEAVDQAFN